MELCGFMEFRQAGFQDLCDTLEYKMPDLLHTNPIKNIENAKRPNLKLFEINLLVL